MRRYNLLRFQFFSCNFGYQFLMINDKRCITLSYPGRIGTTHHHSANFRACYRVYSFTPLETNESWNLEISKRHITSMPRQEYDIQLWFPFPLQRTRYHRCWAYRIRHRHPGHHELCLQFLLELARLLCKAHTKKPRNLSQQVYLHWSSSSSK